jgi:hypothetical protein
MSYESRIFAECLRSSSSELHCPAQRTHLLVPSCAKHWPANSAIPLILIMLFTMPEEGTADSMT